MIITNKKKLFDLQRERDELKDMIECMIDNNTNIKKEILQQKKEMSRILGEAVQIKASIDGKKKTFQLIYKELGSLLKSYCSHLEKLIKETERECELDWQSLLDGDYSSFEEFLENFTFHRKDLHIYRIKAQRLSKDLSLLDSIA